MIPVLVVRILFWNCTTVSFSNIFPPSCVFPFLSLTCPFPASLHLHLIPSLVCVYKVLVFHSCLRLIVPWSPVMPPCVSRLHSQCLPVVFLFFCCLCFHSFVLWFCLHFVQALLLLLLLFSGFLVFCISSFLFAFYSPILPPVCCLHLHPHLASHNCNRTNWPEWTQQTIAGCTWWRC